MSARSLAAARLGIWAVAAWAWAGAAAPNWKLVWSDEFTGTGLPDTAKWGYEVGFVRNQEAQYYTKARTENIRLDSGNLVIEARKEKYAGTYRGKDTVAQYTSASINTFGKASWTYGRFEVRAKIPTGTGSWPAIWTLGDNHLTAGWPLCGEMDIMENVGFDPNVVQAHVHTQKYNHINGNQRGASLTLDQPWKSFHLYAMEWYPTRVDFFVDSVKYFTFNKESDSVDAWPFAAPQYLLLNLAIGGSWGGQHGIDTTIFPLKFYIDYVRIYRQDSATTSIGMFPSRGPRDRALPVLDARDFLGRALQPHPDEALPALPAVQPPAGAAPRRQ